MAGPHPTSEAALGRRSPASDERAWALLPGQQQCSGNWKRPECKPLTPTTLACCSPDPIPERASAARCGSAVAFVGGRLVKLCAARHPLASRAAPLAVETQQHYCQHAVPWGARRGIPHTTLNAHPQRRARQRGIAAAAEAAPGFQQPATMPACNNPTCLKVSLHAYCLGRCRPPAGRAQAAPSIPPCRRRRPAAAAGAAARPAAAGNPVLFQQAAATKLCIDTSLQAPASGSAGGRQGARWDS